MRIIYTQPDSDGISSLSRLGIKNCYFKKLNAEQDKKAILSNLHHHTDFEIHIISDGHQEYEVEDKIYKLEKGNFLMISPSTPHRIILSLEETEKYSITFGLKFDGIPACTFGQINGRIIENIRYILSEADLKKEFSLILIENAILEIILNFLRTAGIKENPLPKNENENALLKTAKKYIKDNTEHALKVSDVSGYCHLSSKQLTRVFLKYEGVSPGDYIKKIRAEHIEKLLSDSSVSLKQISDRMGFTNEYYFNAFFKKYSGMPPGAFRKMSKE